MKISIRQMEIFLEVSTISHLTHVAHKMGLSQSAISMSIKELEGIMGYRLFDRINKKLVLNERGRAYKRAIAPLVAKLNDIEEEFKNSDNSGEVVVGASTTIADYLMPHIVCKYMQSYPKVKIRLKIGNTQEVKDWVLKGKVDLAYVEGNVESSQIYKEAVGTDELIIITGDRELAAIQESYYIDTLLNYRWIIREEGSGTREVFLSHLGELSSQLNIFLDLGHPETIKSMLQQNKGCLSCLPKISVMKEIDHGELFEVKVKKLKFERQFLMLCHKDKYRSTLFQKFQTFVRMHLATVLGR